MGREPGSEKGTGSKPEPLGCRPSGIRIPRVSSGLGSAPLCQDEVLGEEGSSQGNTLGGGHTRGSPKGREEGRGANTLDELAHFWSF